MARNPGCAVYIGNLDEKVSERVLYEILIQVGRVVDLHIPRDKETSRPKGYAFAEYETEEIAQYAVRLFSGLVRLHNRTLKFAISGQDKPSSNINVPVTPKMNPIPLPNPPQPMRFGDTPVSQHRVVNGRIAGYGVSPNHSYDFHSQASSGVASRGLSDAELHKLASVTSLAIVSPHQVVMSVAGNEMNSPWGTLSFLSMSSFFLLPLHMQRNCGTAHGSIHSRCACDCR